MIQRTIEIFVVRFIVKHQKNYTNHKTDVYNLDDTRSLDILDLNDYASKK